MPYFKEVTDADYQSLAEFRYQIRRFLHFSEQAARAAGMEPQQHQLLLALRGMTGAQADIGTLAERLQIQHHSTVELVDRLAVRDLVARSRAVADRRHVLIELTDRGAAELEKLAQSHLEELRRNGPMLVEALETLLRRSQCQHPN
jgi:DNA-binding MarR family transcriptional regulator